MLKREIDDRSRLSYLAIVFLLLALWIIARLFILQILEHEYYSLFALNTHELYEKLHSDRGEIYFQDSRVKAEYPAAINKEFYLVYAAPVEIPSSSISSTVYSLSSILEFDDSQKQLLRQKLMKVDDKYEQVAKKVSAEKRDLIKRENLPGVYFTPETYRYYPEENLGGNVLGFVGFDENDKITGRYGLEGYWEKKISGKGGFAFGERAALGSWITLSNRTVIKPENGANLLLTIDRALEFKACERLRAGLEEYGAKSAALVLLEAHSGAALALCSLPDFDPNKYSQAEDLRAFNNTTVFGAYEPGSVFKPITMAAGLDLGLITPDTVFTDPCKRAIDDFEIRNADGKCYGVQTMTQVLEKSINMGVVWAQEKIGNEKFSVYVDKFGFGQRTGIELSSESTGDVSSLKRRGHIFGANGSFGQGLTATPIQLAAAYSAIANEGKLPQAHVVEEVRYPDGKIERNNGRIAEQVISARSAKLLSGMLTSVVENHYTKAQIPGYYVAGKTGTAQIAEKGRYSFDRVNHTFAGFAPATAPRLVLVVKYEEPKLKWAEQTALPVFRDVMKFALDYYGIPGDKR